MFRWPPGWRSWEHLIHSAISPDALVYLKDTPLDSGWHYVEYERSARSQSRVWKKLAGYRSDKRQNAWPVMVICWNSEVESLFQDVALGSDISMFTTHIKRLEAYGPMNNGHCWNLIDEPVVIGRLPEDEVGAVSEGTDPEGGTEGALTDGLAASPGTAS